MACTASVWTGMPCGAARATTSSTGWSVPTSLLAHITEIRRDALGVALDGVAQGLHVEAPVAVDGQQLELGTLALGEPVQRVEHGVVLDRSGQDAAAPVVTGRDAPSRCP